MNASIHDKKESEVRDMGLFTDGFKLLKKASEPLYKTPKSIQETIEIIILEMRAVLILISKRQRRSGQILEMICAMAW